MAWMSETREPELLDFVHKQEDGSRICTAELPVYAYALAATGLTQRANHPDVRDMFLIRQFGEF